MANIVAGTRSQPPTISTMVFVSRNCRVANSISQHHGPLACRIRRRCPILNPHTGHNLQLLANDGPSFSRKQAFAAMTLKNANNKYRIHRKAISADKLDTVCVLTWPPEVEDGIPPSDSAGEGTMVLRYRISQTAISTNKHHG